jgi:hypothetical protein
MDFFPMGVEGVSLPFYLYIYLNLCFLLCFLNVYHDASINNTQEYTLVSVFVKSANSELNNKSA